jgi:hypothetical protein
MFKEVCVCEILINLTFLKWHFFEDKRQWRMTDRQRECTDSIVADAEREEREKKERKK